MPIHIDITQDLRYQQGIEKGKAEDRNEIAENLLRERLAVSFVQKVTNLSLEEVEKIVRQIEE